MIFYRIYQLLIMLPILLTATILAAILTALGSILFGGKWWGYWPAHIWAKLFCIMTFVKVTVVGRENISKGTSYVFVANHQGAYDIFSIYGYLNHNFKWMMKKSLERIPLVGYSCRKAGHIYVDNHSPAAIRQTMQDAEKQLAGGMSVVVFPEGSRTFDGKVHAFRRGAYTLAVEFGLPVVPVTIDGAFDVMPRTSWLPRPGHIKLTIHQPIEAPADGHDLKNLIEQSRKTIISALPAELSEQ
ncbi:MAG: 1-acyl-sn-glycerol-3-phosphate acyltransferase [Muribaculaceae bacterium]|nr:1-acyl-sn-glycerol-3-phosphate acyltransferase [Muribaculaceae bacterium]